MRRRDHTVGPDREHLDRAAHVRQVDATAVRRTHETREAELRVLVRRELARAAAAVRHGLRVVGHRHALQFFAGFCVEHDEMARLARRVDARSVARQQHGLWPHARHLDECSVRRQRLVDRRLLCTVSAAADECGRGWRQRPSVEAARSGGGEKDRREARESHRVIVRRVARCFHCAAESAWLEARARLSRFGAGSLAEAT